MYLTQLTLSDFRNFSEATIFPTKGCNLFFGHNGAGKTNLLESLYYLAHGRSFRVKTTQALVKSSAERYIIHAKLEEENEHHSVGVEKNLTGHKTIHVNEHTHASMLPIAALMPVQWISTNTQKFFYAGAKKRCQLLNWGVFHMEPGFQSLWKTFNTLLRQRNAAIKQGLSAKALAAWDAEWIPLNTLIQTKHNNYLQALTPFFRNLLANILPSIPIDLLYRPGWPEHTTLEQVLEYENIRSRRLGYTTVGSHKADIALYYKEKPISEFLSQGQQKLAMYALYLAQGLLLTKQTGKHPIYLIDDIASELDKKKQRKIQEIITEMQAQLFITCVEKEDFSTLLPNLNYAMFHVEQGTVSPISSA